MANNITTENLKKQFQENKQLRTITYIILGVIVLILGLILYRVFISGPKEVKSQDAYYSGLNYAAKDSTDKAIQELEAAVKKFDGYSGGENAQFVLGRQYMQKGNFKKAIDAFEGVKVSDTYIQIYAVGLQGDCYSEMNKYKEALDKYEEAASINENDKTTPDYLFKAALVAEQLENYEKAGELYEKIRDEYPVFAGQRAIEKYIARTKRK